jgi:hypothetical protein
MSKHPMFSGLNGGQEGVCCVSSGASAVVKPLCLIGEQPCCKDVSQAQCCTNKAEYPPTGDIEPRVASLFIKCCNCCPFACDPKICDEVKPIGDLSGAGNLSDVHTAKAGDHFLLLSCCCCNLSEYIPDTYVDAFGAETKSVCCCWEFDLKRDMLPKDQGAPLSLPSTRPHPSTESPLSTTARASPARHAPSRPLIPPRQAATSC